jgi:type VI secretion system FHA domain protein
MELILQIVNGVGPGARESERRKTFGRVGGRIGRAADCEWVLPSPYVSRHHATVSHAGNTFYIESAGENGIALNDPAKMLPRLDRHALKNGDRLFIDEMEIEVTLVGAGTVSDASPGIPELHANTGLHGNAGLQANLSGPGGGAPLGPSPDDLDPLKRLLGDAGPLAETAERAIPWNNSSSLADHFAPPRLEQAASPVAAGSIAEDWDDEAAARPAFAHRAPLASGTMALSRAPSASAIATSVPAAPMPEALVSALLSTPPAQVAQVAQVATSAPGTAAPVASDFMRSMLQGLIDERQSRALMAAELRLRSLPLAPSNPNPLHHSVNADDALRLLAASPEAGRMTGAQAVTDALDEIRAHQLATSAAIQAAFRSMLSCFDPQALEARFDRRLKHAGVLPIGSKFRYWQLYVELFEELASGSDSGFQKLFGEAFADAYAETYTSQHTALKGRARQPAHRT